MKTPSIYDDIRPFDPEELPAAFERLLSDAQFQQDIFIQECHWRR